jgi:hypothetical protein
MAFPSGTHIAGNRRTPVATLGDASGKKSMARQVVAARILRQADKHCNYRITTPPIRPLCWARPRGNNTQFDIEYSIGK